MLRSLNIENIAVIEKCSIDFSDGMNVLTGETGAGKSIVIDSINAVMGQRTSRELVRTECEKATVSAVFDDVSEALTKKLSGYGVNVEDNSIMVLRSISSDGKNICKVNGISVNVSVLREIGTMLVNIHGQHDSQALLNPEKHCGFIDAYGNYDNISAEYRDCYGRLKSVSRALKSLVTDENEKLRRIDILKYQINEIKTAKVNVGELNDLIKKRDVIRNSVKIRESLEQCHNLLSGDDDTDGAGAMCEEAVTALMPCLQFVDGAMKLSERLTSATAEIQEIAAEMRNLCDGFEFDVSELETAEQRIDLLNSLIRKYGGSESKVLEFLSNAENELSGIENADEQVKKLEEQYEQLEDELVKAGNRLTDKRKQSAAEFTSKVCNVLQYLEMPNVMFFANFEQGMYTVNGCDKVEFLISANAGEDPKPLSKIASGGELSRIMLAIKSVMTGINDADTLIFDEIDSGISGRAADKVGLKMKELSQSRQVICVTHLAQIAAAASNHFYISKSSENGKTYTDVKRVSGDERITEIARIMSGGEITESLYRSAKELIESHS